MRFGTFNIHSIPPWTNDAAVAREQFDQMLAADRLGFHELWLAEHNARRYAMVGNVVTLAAALATATKQIRISTAVTRLPLHNPLRLAEDLAYVDIISGGRLDWGVGKGYDRLEFDSYGVDFETRESRWAETLEAILHMWKTGRTKFDGEFVKHGDGELLPMPLQRPQVPIYVMVAGSESSISWASKHLFPVAFTSGPAPEQLRDRLSYYGDLASKFGYSDGAIAKTLQNSWQLKPMHVGETTEIAVAGYRRGLEWYMTELGNRIQFGFSGQQQDYEYFVQHQGVMIGSAERVGDLIADYQRRSGVNNLICWFNMGGQPHQQVLDGLERFAADAMPKFVDVSDKWHRAEAAPGQMIHTTPD